MLSQYLPKHWGHLSKKVDLIEERLPKEFLPAKELVFRALKVQNSQVKVVIIGQDPYPAESHACGIAFSVPSDCVKIPPTLKNILKELSDDLGIESISGDLGEWSDQGVVLLNSILTVSKGESLSHANLGWEDFTSCVVEDYVKLGAIFILWGKGASKYEALIPQNQRISSPHPSPLSAYRGFLGSKPFSRANTMLKISGRDPIDWKV